VGARGWGGGWGWGDGGHITPVYPIVTWPFPILYICTYPSICMYSYLHLNICICIYLYIYLYIYCSVGRRCRVLVFLALPAMHYPGTYYPATYHPATYHPAPYHPFTQLRITQLPSSVSLSYPASPSNPAAYLSPRYMSTSNPFKTQRKPVWLHLASFGEPRGFL
jgi:hypothetical protein